MAGSGEAIDQLHDKLRDNEVQYAPVWIRNVPEAGKEKPILVVWKGPETSVLRQMKMSHMQVRDYLFIFESVFGALIRADCKTYEKYAFLYLDPYLYSPLTLW